LQSSLRPLPILNAENHIIRDGEEKLIPSDHIYTSVFEQFLQGAGGIVTWVWVENTFERNYDAGLRGCIYHRPTDIIAQARAVNDANRLAEPISAYVKAEPEVALLYSPSSLIQNAESWSASLIDTYTRLCFTGHKIGFISEKQLAKGEFGKLKAIILTNATHLPTDAAEALARFAEHGGAIFAVGDAPKYNSFGGNLPVKLPVDAVGVPDWKEWQDRLDRLSPLPVSLETEGGNEGIFFRTVSAQDGSWLVHLVNYNFEPRKIRLEGAGEWFDLIREREFQPEFELAPLKPQLLRFTPKKR